MPKAHPSNGYRPWGLYVPKDLLEVGYVINYCNFDHFLLLEGVQTKSQSFLVLLLEMEGYLTTMKIPADVSSQCLLN